MHPTRPDFILGSTSLFLCVSRPPSPTRTKHVLHATPSQGIPRSVESPRASAQRHPRPRARARARAHAHAGPRVRPIPPGRERARHELLQHLLVFCRGHDDCRQHLQLAGALAWSVLWILVIASISCGVGELSCTTHSCREPRVVHFSLSHAARYGTSYQNLGRRSRHAPQQATASEPSRQPAAASGHPARQ